MAEERDGNVRWVVATWMYLLHAAGIDPQDEELVRAFAGVDDAKEAEPGEKEAMRLVERVESLLESHDDPGALFVLAQRLYGDRVQNSLGAGERDERTLRIRKAQFQRNLPWLARIWERRDGRVRPTWLLIERVTDEVTAMDPNPWNQVDEERRIPLGDFQVLWELDGCSSVYVE